MTTSSSESPWRSCRLSAFTDLYHVSSFGFRGEALSSLCAVGDLVVTTATDADNGKGVRLRYDQNGRLVRDLAAGSGGGLEFFPRARGTTVTLSNLFSTLPVRSREFKRTIKKQFAKCLEVVQAYALISAGGNCVLADRARGSSPGENESVDRIKLVNTNGAKSMKDNVVNIFGARIVPMLLEVDLDLVVVPARRVLGLQDGPTSSLIAARLAGSQSSLLEEEGSNRSEEGAGGEGEGESPDAEEENGASRCVRPAVVLCFPHRPITLVSFQLKSTSMPRYLES
ncbi:hypothetical protein BDK51DRAFT_51536 [Blyttiomyces helicus]|uniref:Uncharacterized protein n=1 Tax=Blyttiomyces helicus TaxID=388810 RepID=A0A4P9WGU0_9FUNG|nr:hypothetical protein BDK51DRAFT_51536 [Blyttiomyces helicus]|eukprot:RKO91145.1 hypothetical protein BDK51DRAFT_51536 [Blyttiomyces helicus]